MSSKSRSRSRSKPKDDRRVYVTGFATRDTEDDIKKLFKPYGTIEDFSWKGRFCFITYAKPEEAQEAIKEMHRKEFNNNPLQVEQARSKRNDGVCYTCGKPGHFARNCRDRRSHHRRRRRSSSDSSSSSHKKKHKKRKRSSSSSSSD